MTTTRLEAFSDGVIAIIITIMVLELKVPHGSDWSAIKPVAPVFLNYVLSFIYVGIYWNNHHHMLHVTTRVNGKILWANLHLLFWLSLIPFVTGWMGENEFAALPTAIYGAVLFFSSNAFAFLSRSIIADQGKGSVLDAAVGKNVKGRVSTLLYACAIPLAFLQPWISVAIYVGVACMWFIPDRRLEAKVAE